MNAVATRTPTTRAVPAQRLLPATAVEPMPDEAHLPHLFGRQMIQVHASLCWPNIENGDVLEVDFDVRSFKGDYFYLVTMHDNGPTEKATWFGARFFMRGVRGPMVREETADGPNWIDAPPEMMARFKFHGVVRDVWKKARLRGCP